MSKKIALIVFLLIPAALSTEYVDTCFGDAKEAEMPKYSVGDWWKFNVDYKEEIGLLGTATYEVTSDSSEITQFGTTFVCYEFNITGSGIVYGQLYGEGITGTWTMNGKTYLLKSDLSEVKLKMTTDATFTYVSVSMTMKQVIETTYNPPLESYKGFPITAGESWSAATTETTITQITMDGHDEQETNTTTSTKNYFVLRTQSTTVSAGEFDTFVIKTTATDGSYTEQYFSPEAGFAVKEEGYNATGTLQVTVELLEFNYTVAKGELSLLYIMIGSVIAVVVVVSGVAYVLHKRRKPPNALAPPTSPMEQPPEAAPS